MRRGTRRRPQLCDGPVARRPDGVMRRGISLGPANRCRRSTWVRNKPGIRRALVSGAPTPPHSSAGALGAPHCLRTPTDAYGRHRTPPGAYGRPRTPADARGRAGTRPVEGRLTKIRQPRNCSNMCGLREAR